MLIELITIFYLAFVGLSLPLGVAAYWRPRGSAIAWSALAIPSLFNLAHALAIHGLGEFPLEATALIGLAGLLPASLFFLPATGALLLLTARRSRKSRVRDASCLHDGTFQISRFPEY